MILVCYTEDALGKWQNLICGPPFTVFIKSVAKQNVGKPNSRERSNRPFRIASQHDHCRIWKLWSNTWKVIIWHQQHSGN